MKLYHSISYDVSCWKVFLSFLVNLNIRPITMKIAKMPALVFKLSWNALLTRSKYLVLFIS